MTQRLAPLLGGVFQLGYVVTDLDAALTHWIDRFGVGPWYVFKLRGAVWRCGASTTLPDLSIALSNSGDVQVELIQQHDQAPSMYLDYLARCPGGGLQHLGYLPADYDAALAAAQALGFGPGQEGSFKGGRFAYLDCEAPGQTGTVIELVEPGEQTLSFFAHIRDQAAAWDGETQPVHRIGAER
ncbi:MAG: VOC family protein [Acidimicrobiales bacterium]